MPRRRMCFLLLILTLILSSGCGSNNKGTIEGTKWVNEPTTVDGKRIPAGTLIIEFAKDGKLRFGPKAAPWTGTYSTGAGDTVVFRFNRAVAGREKHYQKISINGDVLTLKDSDGKAGKFRRVK